MRTLPFLAASVLALCSPAVATAQSGTFAIGAGASTLGFGPSASVRLAGPLAVRAGANWFRTTIDDPIDTEIAYDVTPDLFTIPVVLEVHPTNGAFYLAGGLVKNGNEARLFAENTQTLTIDGVAYGPDQVSSVEGAVTFKDWAPYAGLGFDGSVFGGGRVKLFFDLGVMFQGKPTASLRANSTLTGAEREALEQGVQAAEDEVQQEIDDAGSWTKYYPVIGLGLRIRL